MRRPSSVVNARNPCVRPSVKRTAMGSTAGALVAAAGAPRFDPAQSTRTARWYKGNTHTHTLNSDGDSTPDEVVRWYRSHGYQFLVLTDHNYLTAIDGLNALHGAADQ